MIWFVVAWIAVMAASFVVLVRGGWQTITGLLRPLAAKLFGEERR